MVGSLILGFFDGVHIGHRAVIDAAKELSDDCMLLTLKDSPALYFGKNKEYIYTREKSLNLIKNLGVNKIVELDFGKIVTLPADIFLAYIADKYSPKNIITGFNHTFGFNKEGNSELLKMYEKKYNYNYKCVLPSMYEDEIVSSSLIKELLKKGNIGRANLLLKNRFSLEGEVIHGAEIGRTIGFPTANINYPSGIVSVPYGVYAVFVELPNGDKHRAIMNWGMKPTVNNTKEPVAEIHILDYMGDLYGKIINVELIERIRGEEKFSDLDELRAQITKDIEACLKL